MNSLSRLVSLLFISVFFLNGCDIKNEAADPLVVNHLVDSPIEGVTYTCGSIVGTTTATGEFSCKVTPVTFSIGEWEIGSISAFTVDNIIYPNDLVGVPRDNVTDADLITLTRVLQSLDDDGNYSETLKITPATAAKFDKTANTATATELAALAGVTLVDEQTAIDHLKKQLTDTIAPSVTAPSNSNVDATTASGIPVSAAVISTFLSSATAVDNVSVVGGITNNAPSVFPIGTTTVTFTAVDANNNSGTATATVTVKDTTAPTVTAPANITVVGTSSSGIDATASTIATFLSAATATDNIAVVGSITHNAPTIFPVGTTSVTFSASDVESNTGTATATITVTAPVVADTENPVVTAPANISLTGGASASGLAATDSQIVSFLASASATDNVSVVNITNNAPTNFPEGDTTITFTATDAAGNIGTATAVVTITAPTTTVVDTQAPVVTAPANITLTGTSSSGIAATASEIVTFLAGASATDNVGVVGSVTNDAPSNFPVGETTVTFTAKDAKNNAGTATATVTITAPATTGSGFQPSTPTYPSITLRAGVDVRNSIASLYAEALPTFRSQFNVYDSVINCKITNSYIDFSKGEHSFKRTCYNTKGEETYFGIKSTIGDDGISVTEDDRIIGYSMYVDNNAWYTEFNGAGEDGKWFTADDVTTNGYLSLNKPFEYKNSNYQLTLSSGIVAGTDKILFTADDNPSAYAVTTIDSNGHEAAITVFNGSGLDGVWFTADDRIREHSVSSIDANGNAFQSITFSGDGADNQWYTLDDDILIYTSAVLNNNKIDALATYTTGSDKVGFNGDDVLQSQTFFTYDSNGYTRLVVSYTSIGWDNLWFTADDSAAAISYAHSADGKKTEETTHTKIGADNQWLTGDDTITKRFLYNADGTLAYYYYHPGVDGLWFTADDIGENRTPAIVVKDANGNIISITSPTGYIENKYDPVTNIRVASVTVPKSNYGIDGVPHTADDIPRSGTFGILHVSGKYFSDFYTLATSGSDGKWFTDDDTYSAYIKNESNAQGKISKRKSSSAIGADSVWGSSDDVLNAVTIYSYDVNGRLIDRTEYAGSGSDGIWETADDQIYSIYKQIYDDVDKTRTLVSYVDPGDDAVWRTADDVVSSLNVTVETLNIKGLVTQYIPYKSSGNDGVWLTADDEILIVLKNSYDENDTLNRSLLFTTSGDDGIWLTDDDVSTGYFFYVNTAEGLEIKQIFYNEKGDDGIWWTDDDIKTFGRVSIFPENFIEDSRTK